MVAAASSPLRNVVGSTPARPQSSVMSMPCASRWVSSASTSSSASSSACASSSSSDRLMQPRSSPRAISAATSGREVSSCATARMLRSRGAGCREAVERAPQQARHVHLGDADALGDLRLGQVLLEAKPQDQPLARGQRLQGAAQRLADLDELVARAPRRTATRRASSSPPRRCPGAARPARRPRRPWPPPSPRARPRPARPPRPRRRAASASGPASTGRLAERLADLQHQLLRRRAARAPHQPLSRKWRLISPSIVGTA